MSLTTPKNDLNGRNNMIGRSHLNELTDPGEGATRPAGRRRRILGAFALGLAATSAALGAPAASAGVREAPTAEPPVAGPEQHVVAEPHPSTIDEGTTRVESPEEEAASARAKSTGAVTGPFRAVVGHNRTMTITIEPSSEAEIYRPILERAAASLHSITGLTVRVAAGTSSDVSVRPGYVRFRVRNTHWGSAGCGSLNSTDWVGCAGPTLDGLPDSQLVITGGQITVKPGMRAELRTGDVYHELGHVFGLDHFTGYYDGQHQIMYPVVQRDVTGYRSGDVNGVHAMSTIKAATTHDLNCDGKADMVARRSDNAVVVHPGDGAGHFGAATVTAATAGPGDRLFLPGDLDGDSVPDLVRQMPSGDTYLYRGSCNGWFPAWASRLASGWAQYQQLTVSGDFTGDGRPDFIGLKADGTLWAISWNGSSLAAPVRVGTGAFNFDALMGTGDFDRDGRNDLLARTPDGRLWLYAGDGRGAFAAHHVIGTGWGGRLIVAPGSIDGDRFPDALERRNDGSLWVHHGTGTGYLSGSALVGASWGAYTLIV